MSILPSRGFTLFLPIWCVYTKSSFIETNREDCCTRHFWESRLKRQALLDKKALATAMPYVDLNPVRAAIEKTPEDLEFPSVKVRIESLRKEQLTTLSLFPFVGNPRGPMPESILFRLTGYLTLVDWTDRQIRDNKEATSKRHCRPYWHG